MSLRPSKFTSLLLALSFVPLSLPQAPGNHEAIIDQISTIRDSVQSRIQNIADSIPMTMTEHGPAVSDELIVKYKHASQFEVKKLARGSSLEESLEALRLRADIEYVEPNYIAHAFMTPNDPYYSLQWNLPGIDMEQAWDASTGTGVTVAVIDTGVAYEDYTQSRKRYYRAPDLANTIFIPGYDFANNDTHPNDDNGHGTHVTGTIAQSTNNNLGGAGIAYNARIMPIKALNAQGSGSYAAIANSIRYAADHGAKVISMSLGGSSSSLTLESALQYAFNKGVVIIAASGNNGIGSVSYPAAYDDYVIAVGATRFDQTKTSYANWGSALDLVAPGGDMTVDQNADGYGDGILQQTFSGSNYGAFGYYFFEGTSMATPHVAAVAALVLAHGNATTPEEVRAALESTATDLGAPGRDTLYGYGLVNPVAALAWNTTPPPPPPSPTAPSVTLTVNGSDDPITVPDQSVITLAWTTTHFPATCTASDAWSGAKSVNGGSENTGSLAGTSTLIYTISCANAAGTSTDSVLVNVSGPIPPPPPPPPPEDIVVFSDSFEISEWNGLWTEGPQNDWQRSAQRSVDGTRSAEIDGKTVDGTITSTPINLQGKTNATISFSWYIESGLDTGEYMAFDISIDGGTTWVEKARLRGNVDQENVWHQESVALTNISTLQVRFRGSMSLSSEDANVDNVRVLAN